MRREAWTNGPPPPPVRHRAALTSFPTLSGFAVRRSVSRRHAFLLPASSLSVSILCSTVQAVFSHLNSAFVDFVHRGSRMEAGLAFAAWPGTCMACRPRAARCLSNGPPPPASSAPRRSPSFPVSLEFTLGFAEPPSGCRRVNLFVRRGRPPARVLKALSPETGSPCRALGDT